MSLNTRLQTNRAENTFIPKRWAKFALEIARELRARRLVKGAAAVQCNGYPTYTQYKNLNDNTMLFFDTRTTLSGMALNDGLQKKLAKRRQSNDKLRLVYSGRMIAMKGVDHLIEVARELVLCGVDFELSLCGDGPLLPRLRQLVKQYSLERVVKFAGNLDFETELVPFVRDEIDVFVCCHVQGDPSCTYLETMACGVPICGYANEALSGLVTAMKGGWITPLGDPKALAYKLAELGRSELEPHSQLSLEFARSRSFEAEFDRRMAQCRAIVTSVCE